MGDRPFLSIGEVLDLLKADFPDVTISKIRFLESQGLVDPERTPSGYRKFHDDDIGRLRWILLQQREHFLPLKVIKERLERDGGALPTDAAPVPAARTEGPDEVARPEHAESRRSLPGNDAHTLSSGLSAATFTREELARASGCDLAALRDLERYGLLTGRDDGGTTSFDEESLIVARLAAGFARHGVEARHLRMYRTAVDREAGFFAQVVLPMIKQRNPVARRQSIEALADLVRLGEGIRGSLLRQALRPYTEGS